MLGGSPSVWTTILVFFQAMLLIGYLYAHFSTKYFNIKVQLVVHFLLIACVFFWLPFSIPNITITDIDSNPTLWLLTVCFFSIGLPFFMVSSTAPLLQKWFSYSDHIAKHDPYFLYAASNAGALLALISYPIIIEPLLTINFQKWTWSFVYLLLVFGLITCGVIVSKIINPIDSQQPNNKNSTFHKTTWGRRLLWISLSFIPSAMLLGVTLYISTDVAAAPFLWIAPLFIYLLSFVLVFSNRLIISRETMLSFQVYTYISLAIYFTATELWFVLGLHLAVLFVTAMVCHGRLADSRPAVNDLTEFFLWISVGGVLGGMFSAILAPIIFNSALEYPLTVIGACILRPKSTKLNKHDRLYDFLLPMVLALFYLVPELILKTFPLQLGTIGPAIFYAIIMFALLSFSTRRIRFTLGLVIVLFGFQVLRSNEEILHMKRSFFGIYTVESKHDGLMHALYHGTTIHGAQAINNSYIKTPMTYYNQAGPLGQIIAYKNRNNSLMNIGAIGLGIGTLACYKHPGQKLTFYEIDPAVIEIAKNPNYFRFLDVCGGSVDIVIGDGRRMIEREPREKFDLLVLDAFSSDAIPVHLLTREAFIIYLDKLKPDGLLLLHVSNRYVDLAPVIANIASNLNLHAWVQSYVPTENALQQGAFESEWVVISSKDNQLSINEGTGNWTSLVSDDYNEVWTDDYANLFKTLKWEKLFWMR